MPGEHDLPEPGINSSQVLSHSVNYLLRQSINYDE